MSFYRIVLAILLIYLYVLQLYVAYPFTVDDSFISLNYAKHWAEGQGLVWFQGELPLEGYSNFLYVWIAAVLFKLSLPALVILKSISIISLGLTVIALYHISMIFLPKSLAILPSVLMLLYRGEIIWTVSGLETATYQLWVVLTVLCLLKGLAHRKYGFFIGAGLIQGLAGLTRPEGPALCLMFAAALIALSWREEKANPFFKKALLYYGVSFIILYLPYFVLRWHYFGRFFPNPIYCKALTSTQLGYTDAAYLFLVLPLLVFMLPAFYRRWDRQYVFLLLPNLLYLFLLLKADFVVAFFNRLFLPVFVLLLPLLVLGIYQLYQFKKNPLHANTHIKLVALTSLLIGYFLIHSFSLSDYQRFVAHAGTQPEKTRREIATWIETEVRSNEVVGLGDCGIIPFLTTRRIIDTYCLNAREMTEPPISLSYSRYANWLLYQVKPRYLIVTNMTKDHFRYYQPLDALLYQHEVFKKHYHQIRVFHVRPDYFYELYQRDTNKASAGIKIV